MPKYASPTSYTGRQSNSNLTGAARAANASEAAAGSSTQLYISPSTLASAVGDLVPSASSTVEGVVFLTEGTSSIAYPVATKFYADNLAIAGAPAWSETVSGIGQLATTAETVAYTLDTVAITPLKLGSAFAAPPAMGSGTPAAGSFTTLAASGLSSLSGSATILTAGTALNLASDADTAAVNIGTGAAARTITIGNISGATAVNINTGTGSFTVATTGTGDIVLNSDDTVLIDADGVLELNSSAGVISIGNDADSQNMNLGTAGARVISIGNNTGATQLVLESGSGGIGIGIASSAQSVSIGNSTGASAIAMLVGSGNFTLDGVTGSTYNIGASTTTGSVTIGGTAQTGNFVLSPSTGAMTMSIANSNGTKTINIGSGINGNTISVGNGANSSAQIINLAAGASAANSTVNILSGNGSAGTQTLNALTGNRAGAINLGTGAAAHVLAVGSSSAGAITVDTAAGISLDAATASNFTVTGAADLSIITTAGSLNLSAGEAAADALNIDAGSGGLDVNVALQMNLDSAQAAADAIRIIASNAGGGIDIDCGTTGAALDSTGAISLQGAAASDFSVSGAGIDLSLISAGGRVVVNGEEAADDAVRVLSAAGGLDLDVALSCILTTSETNADSMQLVSAGGLDITVTGAAGKDIDMTCTSGSVNISAGEAAANAIVINASNAAGGIDLSTGGGSIDLSSAGSVTMVAGTDSQAGDTCTVNKNVFAATFTGFTTAAAASQVFNVTNSVISATSQVILTLCNEGSNDAQMTITRVKRGSGTIAITAKNNGAAALNGNVTVTGWVIG